MAAMLDINCMFALATPTCARVNSHARLSLQVVGLLVTMQLVGHGRHAMLASA